MIKIKFTFSPTAKELYTLNTPFDVLMKQKKEEYDHLFLCRNSSYHDPFANEPNWFKYKYLDNDLEIIIAEDDAHISTEEMLAFVAQHNGFALSRDNLFMLWEVYRQKLEEHIRKTNEGLKIVAIAHKNLLPAHNNGPKICPLLDIIYNKDDGIRGASYDWSWLDDSRTPIETFAFFRKKLL